MAKINLTDVANGTNATTAINANNAVIETKSDTFLSRTGESPNAMEANLDMNSYRILNLQPGIGSTEPVTVGQLASMGVGEGATVGVTDGNKGDITVSNDGGTWLLNTRDIAASNITSGTVSTARLGSGTANSTTYLRGDNTWAIVDGPGGSLPPNGTYGDIDVTDSGATWTIGDGNVTHAKYQTIAANSVLGTAGSSGAPTELPCTATGRGILAASSPAAARGVLSLGDLATLNEVSTAEIAPQAVTHSRYQQIAADTILGVAGTPGVPQELTCTANGRQIIASVNAAATRAWLNVPTVAHSHGEGEITSVSATAINGGGGGVLSTAKLGTGTPTAGLFLRGDGTWSSSLAGSPVLTTSSGLNASQLTTGLVPNRAVLGTGTANGTTFLRGDGAWAVPPGAPGTGGFPACGGTIDTGGPGIGAQWIDTTGMSGSMIYVPFGADTGGVFGDATRTTTGITVAPGATCWYEVTVTIVLNRTGGTTSSSFYVTINDEPLNPIDVGELEPIVTTTALMTTYTRTQFMRVDSGKKLKVAMIRGANTYDFRVNLMVKRITLD